jgi:hypothetical protein
MSIAQFNQPSFSTINLLCHKWLITGFVTRLTRRASLVKQNCIPFRSISFLYLLFINFFIIRSFVLCVCFVDRCLSFFFWPLCCLLFLDLRILITPLVSSNSSYFLHPSFTSKYHLLSKQIVFVNLFSCHQ